MDFDYFYNREAEQFNFLKVPEILVDGEEFKGLSAEAIILYSMLLKRTGTKTIKKIGKVSISAAGLALPPFDIQELREITLYDELESQVRRRQKRRLLIAKAIKGKFSNKTDKCIIGFIEAILMIFASLEMVREKSIDKYVSLC